MERETLLGVVSESRFYPLRLAPSSGVVSRYEGNELGQRLDFSSIEDINSALLRGSVPLHIDANSQIHHCLRMDDATEWCWVLKLDENTHQLEHYPSGEPMTSQEIEKFNGLEGVRLKVSQDGRIMQVGTPDEERNESTLNIMTSGSKFGITESGAGDGIHYSPTPYRQVKEVIKSLEMIRDDVFVDLGCGKGRVLCLAALEPIQRVIGVDLDNELIEIARKNLKSMIGRRCEIDLIHDDLSRGVVPVGSVYYMFGPFGPLTIRHITDGIFATLRTAPRRIRVIWLAPHTEGFEVMCGLPWLRLVTRTPALFENVV